MGNSRSGTWVTPVWYSGRLFGEATQDAVEGARRVEPARRTGADDECGRSERGRVVSTVRRRAKDGVQVVASLRSGWTGSSARSLATSADFAGTHGARDRRPDSRG